MCSFIFSIGHSVTNLTNMPRYQRYFSWHLFENSSRLHGFPGYIIPLQDHNEDYLSHAEYVNEEDVW